MSIEVGLVVIRRGSYYISSSIAFIKLTAIEDILSTFMLVLYSFDLKKILCLITVTLNIFEF